MAFMDGLKLLADVSQYFPQNDCLDSWSRTEDDSSGNATTNATLAKVRAFRCARSAHS